MQQLFFLLLVAMLRMPPLDDFTKYYAVFIGFLRDGLFISWLRCFIVFEKPLLGKDICHETCCFGTFWLWPSRRQ